MRELRVNGERLWQSLMTMAEIGATAKGGVNRQTLTDEDKRGRDLFRRWCEEAGLSVTIDQMGSMFAHRPGGAIRTGRRWCSASTHRRRRALERSAPGPCEIFSLRCRLRHILVDRHVLL